MKIAKKYFLSFIVLTLIFSAQFIFISNINIVHADSNLWDMVKEGGLEEIGSKAYKQSGTPTDPRTITVNVIRIFLTFIGIIFLVLVMLAGYKWMTSQGNEEQVKEARSHLIRSVIGLMIILAAWAITSFVVRYLQQAVDESIWP
jgi:hypothetical protein